jgi:hypothetical protein
MPAACSLNAASTAAAAAVKQQQQKQLQDVLALLHSSALRVSHVVAVGLAADGGRNCHGQEGSWM